MFLILEYWVFGFVIFWCFVYIVFDFIRILRICIVGMKFRDEVLFSFLVVLRCFYCFVLNFFVRKLRRERISRDIYGGLFFFEWFIVFLVFLFIFWFWDFVYRVISVFVDLGCMGYWSFGF